MLTTFLVVRHVGDFVWKSPEPNCAVFVPRNQSFKTLQESHAADRRTVQTPSCVRAFKSRLLDGRASLLKDANLVTSQCRQAKTCTQTPRSRSHLHEHKDWASRLSRKKGLEREGAEKVLTPTVSW